MAFTVDGMTNAFGSPEDVRLVQFAKALSPIVSSLVGSAMVFSWGHPARAEAPMEVMVIGIWISASSVQPSKFDSGMETTAISSRILTDLSFTRLMPGGIGMDAPMDMAVIGQFAKALFPMVLTELGRTKCWGRPDSPSLEQPSNADTPIAVSVEGSEICGSDVQFRKAEAPMVCSLVGKLTWASAEHPEKAKSPMRVISSGRVTVVSCEKPSNFRAGKVVCCGDSKTSWIEVMLDLVIPCGIGAILPMVRAEIAVPLNAPDPTLCTELGMTKESMVPELPNWLQSLNASASMVVSKGGREILRSDVHPRNAKEAMRSSFERGEKVIEARD